MKPLWFAALAVGALVGCEGDDTMPAPPAAAVPGQDGGSRPAPVEAGADSGSPGTPPGDSGTLPACVPVIPRVPWTSPYAAFSRGLPTDPSFFPIAVWLQGVSHAAEHAKLGINVYVGN